MLSKRSASKHLAEAYNKARKKNGSSAKNRLSYRSFFKQFYLATIPDVTENCGFSFVSASILQDESSGRLLLQRIPKKTISICFSATCAPISRSPPSEPDKYPFTVSPVSSATGFSVVPVQHKLKCESVVLFSFDQRTTSGF